MRPTEIAARRARIRLPQKRLAQLAALDENTVCRALRPGANPLNNTTAALERALVAEELALLEGLAELHPEHLGGTWALETTPPSSRLRSASPSWSPCKPSSER